MLRAEKGYIILGQETDGTATPGDVGLSWAVRKKKPDFIGKRSLAWPATPSPARKQLVGLLPARGASLRGRRAGPRGAGAGEAARPCHLGLFQRYSWAFDSARDGRRRARAHRRAASCHHGRPTGGRPGDGARVLRSGRGRASMPPDLSAAAAGAGPLDGLAAPGSAALVALPPAWCPRCCAAGRAGDRGRRVRLQRCPAGAGVPRRRCGRGPRGALARPGRSGRYWRRKAEGPALAAALERAMEEQPRTRWLTCPTARPGSRSLAPTPPRH